MDLIKQYYKLDEIKPAYYQTPVPYFAPSNKRVIFNMKELELHYNENFDVYLKSTKNNKIKTGGKPRKITIFTW
jgi:hypothetical protein